jgi:RNA polymerase sigma factor (sigma-70 family)
VTHPVLQVLNVGDIAELVRADRTDGQLLDLFVKTRDQEAFAAVVRRHGPMVLGVCRRVLRNHADAEDAFQAAFLVLARKAATLGTRGLLAQWLHGVAYNTARKLRRTNARRATRERPLADVPEPATGEGIELRDELLAILDEELSRLPDRYRVPIVLCDLEGVTRKEAARLIGCPEGTVAGRLARARAMLAERLAGRGIAPTAGILAAILTARPAGAVTPELVTGVVRAVGGGTVSVRVADLVERVVTAMFLSKLKSAVVAALVCGLVIAGLASAFRTDATATEPGASPDEKAAKPAPEPPVGDKVLTLIPLRKLDAEATAKVIADSYKEKDVTITAIPDERSLLLYADSPTTKEIEALLVKLGEVSMKKPTVIRLDKTTDCKEAAKVLAEAFGKDRITVAAVPAENALLVYATVIDTQTIRSLLGKAVVAVGKEPPKPAAAPEKTFAVKFQNAAWKDVFTWYAEISGLKLVGEVLPTGTLTLQPMRQFTIGEVTDLLNEALMQQKFILIRRQTSFIIHPADEKVDPTWLPRVELADLPKRGKTELVEVEITLAEKLEAEATAPEVRKLLTPFGEVPFAKGKRLVVRDTASSVRRITETLRAIEADPGLRVPEGYDPRFGPVKLVPTKKFTFNMKDAKWDDVLEWYAKESGLTPILTVKPTGKFTFAPPNPDKQYTIAEITDTINEMLATQKYILVRRPLTFSIHPTDERLESVPQIELSKLDQYGNTELVRVLIPLKTLDAADTASEIDRLLTPMGTISTLNRSNTLVIQDTAGNIRRLYGMLQKVESGDVLTHVCKYKKAQEVADHLKTLLADKKSEKTVAIAVDERANSVAITGPADKIAIAKRILEDFDKGDKPKGGVPEIRKYDVPPGTADAIVKTLQSDHPSLRVIALQASNQIIVFATPEEHFALVAKLAMPRPPSGGPTTVTIPLTRSDPDKLVELLKKLFSGQGGPVIEAGVGGLSSIMVKGTAEQIKAVREAIEAIESIEKKK